MRVGSQFKRWASHGIPEGATDAAEMPGPLVLCQAELVRAVTLNDGAWLGG